MPRAAKAPLHQRRALLAAFHELAQRALDEGADGLECWNLAVRAADEWPSPPKPNSGTPERLQSVRVRLYFEELEAELEREHGARSVERKS